VAQRLFRQALLGARGRPRSSSSAIAARCAAQGRLFAIVRRRCSCWRGGVDRKASISYAFAVLASGTKGGDPLRLRLPAVLIAALALLVANPAQAETTATVTIEPKGLIVGGGQTALVFVTVECTLDPGGELLEGFVTVSQETVFAQGALNPKCDGKPHLNVVRAQGFDREFQAGDAFASAFLLFLVDPETGETVQAQDARVITLSGSPSS
jgi:hypothetical protein